MNESIFGSLAQSRAPAPSPHSRGHVIARPSAAPAHPTCTTLAISTSATSVPTAGSAPTARQFSWSASCDVALTAILLAPLNVGETAVVGFARKESELRRVLATLSVLESRALQARLSNPKSGDSLADSFMRLTAERRARLINFLADARRREATVGR